MTKVNIIRVRNTGLSCGSCSQESHNRPNQSRRPQTTSPKTTRRHQTSHYNEDPGSVRCGVGPCWGGFLNHHDWGHLMGWPTKKKTRRHRAAGNRHCGRTAVFRSLVTHCQAPGAHDAPSEHDRRSWATNDSCDSNITASSACRDSRHRGDRKAEDLEKEAVPKYHESTAENCRGTRAACCPGLGAHGHERVVVKPASNFTTPQPLPTTKTTVSGISPPTAVGLFYL